MKKIHVVIPCYKVEDYIEEAVYSVLNQPYKDIDVILVDDGSPGITPQLCDELAKKEDRVHVIHQENAGLSCARNTGIEYVLAKGVDGYICFLDGDDCWCPGIITEEIARHIFTDWHEDVIGFSGVLSNNAMNRYSEKTSTLETKQVDSRSFVWHSHEAHLGAKLFAVSVFEKWNLRFIPKQLYTEDRIFLCQFYFLAETARFVNKTLHIYRKNQAGIMGNMKKLSAINHYLPIIDGWIKCDDYLNAFEHKTGEHSHIGYTLAAGYMIEMVAEHYRHWGSRKEINEILNNHPHYTHTKNPIKERYIDKVYRENRLFFSKPIIFEMRYRLLGIVEWAMWHLYAVPFIRKMDQKKRYSHTVIPR